MIHRWINKHIMRRQLWIRKIGIKQELGLGQKKDKNLKKG